MSFDFSPIVNWRLLSGSHDFPGPDGGTCINEAAIVAAGFEYKKIGQAADCPPCFSRPLSAYLIKLNDYMPDDQRQKLMRFVLRLSGSIDTLVVETERAKLIVLRTVQRVLPSALVRFPDLACRCREVTTFEEARAAARAAHAAASAASAAAYASADDAAARAAAHAAASAASAAAYAAYAARAAAYAAYAARAAAYAASAAHAAASAAIVWDIAIEIAEEAFAIGRQATPDDVSVVTERMDRARRERVTA